MGPCLENVNKSIHKLNVKHNYLILNDHETLRIRNHESVFFTQWGEAGGGTM